MGFLYDYAPLEDVSNRLAIPALLFSMLPLVVVLLRLAAKNRYPTEQNAHNQSWLGPWGLGWSADDYIILLSSLLSCVGNALMVQACRLGFGKSQRDLIEFANPSMPYGGGQPLIEETMKLFSVDQVLYTVVMMLTKMSILPTYIRCFDTPITTRFCRFCWWILGFIVAFYIGSVFVTIFQCWPISSAWTGRCHPAVTVDNSNLHWWIKANFNIVTDFLLSLLPIKYVLFSQRPLREKIVGGCIILMSLSVGGVAIARTAMIPPADFMEDPMFNAINFCLLSVLEDSMGVICSCIPAFKEPTLHFFPKMLGYSRGSPRSSMLSFACRGESSLKHSDDEKSLEFPTQSTPPKEKDIYGEFTDDLYGTV